MIDAAADSAMEAPPGVLRELWRRDGWAVLAAFVLTLAAELAVYVVAIQNGAAPVDAVLATLAVMTLICAFVPGAMAAGAETALGAVFRGGIVVDATGAALLVLWLLGPEGVSGPALTFLGGCRIYIVLAMMTLMGIAAVRCAASLTGRCCVAVVVAVLLGLALASPIWASAHIGTGLERPVQESVAELAVTINPFYAVTQGGYEGRAFIWHEWGSMYRWTRLGEYVSPPPVAWTTIAGLQALLAVVLAGLAAARWRYRRRRVTGVPAVGPQTPEPPGRDG